MSKEKRKIFMDFDSTITQSMKSYCNCYNRMYYTHSDFKEADYTKETKWNFNDTCPLATDDVNKIFNSTMFFNLLEPYENAIESIKELTKYYHVIITSIGTPDNISNKVQWIKKCLPFISDSILLYSNTACNMDKSIVNMRDGIIVDDHQDNLFSSNASVKILYKHDNKEYSWNKDWKGYSVSNWLDLTKVLTDINKHEYVRL